MQDSRSELIVGARFRGPDTSAHGGYFVGLVAAQAAGTVRVRLLQPPPLDVPLRLVRMGERLEVTHGGALLAAAEPATLSGALPHAPSYMQSLEVARRHPAYAHHPYPHCFVCGPLRARGDGLRIFPGPIAAGTVAAPWMPHASLAGADGKVRPEFMYAALDCPGYFAIDRAGRLMLLGELTAHVDRCVHADEPCVVIGWHIASSGRKHEVGTAIFDEDGELCARARGLWIELRDVATEAP
jgi:hypothetical protein